MTTRRRLSDTSGQGLIEFAMILPFLLLLTLGVIEVGYALLDEHVVTKLAREGSNLISRDTTLEDAVTAIASMSTRPVNFDTGSVVFFSVIRQGATVGTANYGKNILYQRHQYGTLSGPDIHRMLNTTGGAYRGAPDFEAINADTDARLQITNMPANLALSPGGTLYVTEVFTRHTMITPLDRFGVTLPNKLYSVAYF